MIINARYHTGLSLSPSMDYSCARVALLEAQLPADRVLYYQQAEPQGLPEAGHMEYIDSHHHQYKHHHHHHHIQQQALQHHHPHQLPVAGSYVDLGGGFVTTEASPVPFDVLSQVEKEKQGPPQNHYVDQYGSASVQASYKPCEDGYVSVKTHEDSHCPPKACEDAHILPGRHENLHYACDRGYSQHHPQFSMNPSASVQPRIRLLCSIGGRIMGRPVDGKLRYCGGDTRLITVERGICFSDLMAKLTQLYGSPLIVKYQLPGEDLDALVSVSSDDDLQNMLDEYDKLVASGGNSWFRLFMFKVLSDCEIFSHLSFFHESRNCYAEMMQRYVNAINGASELPTDVHLENSLNDHYSSSRMAFDGPNTTLAGSCFSAKPSSWGPSAPSSVPSSPSVAARQTRCRQCGTGDMSPQLPKDHQSFVAPMNNVDLGTQELNQDRHVEALKCDHRQSQILGEGPRIQQDSTFSRGDSLWLKENGTCFVDSHDTFVPQFERHRGTGTIHMDTLPKPLGLIDCQSETCCGSHPVAQSLTSQSYHGGQTEDDFGRVEPAHHCYTEGHKQVPLLHQSHQVGPLVHREGLTRLQRGPAIDSTCADGSLPFSQEPVHPHLQIATVMSSVPTKVMGSAPSSPKDVYHGRCCCCRQHLQVDRGINVSLGEHSHSKKPSHLGDQSTRRLGSPLLSRFCDGSNACFDAAAWHCPQTLGKGLEFDELEHERCLRKHTLDNINTWSTFNEGGAKESSTHGFGGPVHGLHERSLHRCRHCCSDFNDLKGQHKEKARVFPIASEFQAYMGDCDVHRGSHEAAGRLAFDQKTDLNVERGNDSLLGLNFNYGQGELETRISSVQDGRDVSGYAHILVSDPSSILGHQESGRDLKSASFSSTDAVAGSLSRSSLEPPIWVVSSPRPVYEDHSKEVEVRERSPPVDSMASIRQLVDGISNHESTGDACRSSSFSCMDSYGRLRSGDAGECRVENSPVSSLIHVPEDKTNISYAQGSQPKFDNFCSVSSSQPFLMRTLDSDNQKGSIALVMPIYDQSPVSSVSNATFSFAQNEDKSANNGKDVLEQCVNSRNTLTVMPYQSLGQHEDIAQTEADACAHKVPRQEIVSVPEEVKSLSNPSSRQCSVETGAHDKGDVKSKTIPFAQSSMADETLQEVNVSGSANICTEGDEKELPATQAEAEAIARGLQIIKNDGLEDLKELGSGTYGTVFHGKWRGSDVAIKRIKASCFMGRPSMQERLISDFWREAATLSQLHHPNIVAFYGVVPDGPGGTLATVTEYMVNGSLKQVLVKKDRTIDRRKRLLIAMDAAFGMEYLHSKRIVHFDLKSENLLVNMRDAHRPICKVGDFGLSKVKHQTLVSGGVRGTLPWMAPELLSGKGLVTEKVDVYSFGIVMWELLTGEEPYANMHCGTIIGGIANDNLRPDIPSWCDPSWRDLMERCWSGNPADRPGFATVASELRAIASSMNIK